MSHRVTVSPSRWMTRGETIIEAKEGDKPLVIWGGIPGEHSLVQLVHEGRKQVQGIWVSAAEPDPNRVTPPCPKYTTCGACPVMHLTPKGQQKARQELVRQALDKEGLSEVSIAQYHESPVGMRDFRHTIQLSVGHSDTGRLRVGVLGRRKRHLVAIPHCAAVSPVLNRVMASVAHHIIEMDLKPYDPVADTGVLRSVFLRSSHSTNEVLVSLVTGRFPFLLRDFAEALAHSTAEVSGVWVHINSMPSNLIFAPEDGVIGFRGLVGKQCVEEHVGGLEYLIGPGDSFWENPAMAEVLCARLLARLGVQRQTPYIDLNCGVGGFTLQGAARAGWALGVEAKEGSLARARESAHLNKLQAEFLLGEVEEVLPSLKKRYSSVAPAVVISASRRLPEGQIDDLAKLNPRKVAYVSKDPKSMAVDLKQFAAQGFQIEPVELFDMYSHTGQVECLAVCSKEISSPKRSPRRKLVRGVGGSR
ncbi:MAG: 23S rRNA (uracil(1939)-C(5))-methyltransferase RlmD [Proteobacteria bacterium]|jgi:23S rRNA (uracil1939-C5)-methyltransferase|nr:23S rRNA (uracil(1939)-C(5))-methyltransferase RlmD [Pseudomonadota bacterium]